MELYAEQRLKELCETNSIEYSETDCKMWITADKFDIMFDIDDKLIYKVKTCVHIISGKDEMINLVCNRLNTSIKKGCHIKYSGDDVAEFDTNFQCRKHKDNSIIVTIHNIDKVDLSNSKGTTYTS